MTHITLDPELAGGRRLAESIASSQGYDRDQTLHVLNVANFFADALLNDALPANDHHFWADDAQELASLDNQDRAAFNAFVNRLTAMREGLKGLRQQQLARGGVLPVFQSMGCTVEIRPVKAAPFRWDQQVEDYEPKILGTVTVASVYIGVDQGPTKDFHFQADVRDIDNIIASLIAAKKEMVAFGDFLRLDESGSVKNDE